MVISTTVIGCTSAAIALGGFLFTRYRECKMDSTLLYKRISDLEAEQRLLKQQIDSISKDQVLFETELKSVQNRLLDIDVKLSRILTLLEVKNEKH